MLIREWTTDEVLELLEPVEAVMDIESPEAKRVLRAAHAKLALRIMRAYASRAYRLRRPKRSEDVKSAHESFYDVTPGEFLRRIEAQQRNAATFTLNQTVLVRAATSSAYPFAIRAKIGDVVQALDPATVCEVGSGAGTSLFYLAARFAHIDLTGYELTENGVKLAKSLQAIDLHSTAFGEVYRLSEASMPAIRRIRFHQGSAYEIPSGDKMFDLVLTVSALEQMAANLPQALSEIRRIAKRYVVFHEPFKEANDAYGRQFLGSGGYFLRSVQEIAQHGFKPMAFLKTLPVKETHGYGIMVAEVQ